MNYNQGIYQLISSKDQHSKEIFHKFNPNLLEVDYLCRFYRVCLKLGMKTGSPICIPLILQFH